MFDIGFWELLLIGVIALLVVGPERLPGLVRSTGYWVGRGRQMISNVKDEMSLELDKAEQLKELMREQEEIVKRHIMVEDEPEVEGKPRPVAAKPPVVTPEVSEVDTSELPKPPAEPKPTKPESS